MVAKQAARGQAPPHPSEVVHQRPLWAGKQLQASAAPLLEVILEDRLLRVALSLVSAFQPQTGHLKIQLSTVRIARLSKNTHTQRTKTSASDPRWKTVSALNLTYLIFTNPLTNFSSLFLAHCIVDKVIPSDPSAGLFAIFDGHGGRQVSDYCAERFPLEIKKEMQKNPADMT